MIIMQSMKRPISTDVLFILASILHMANFALAAAQTDVPKPKEPVTWKGVIRDDSLRGLAPKIGYAADQQTWTKVWRAWRPKEGLPKVDFTNEIVLITTVHGPNRTMGTKNGVQNQGGLCVWPCTTNARLRRFR